MKIWTIDSGAVIEGAKVSTFEFQNGSVKIPAILVGETGRGSKLGVLPVNLLPESYKVWQEKGVVTIFSANVGTTKTDKPKLFETSSDESPANLNGPFIGVFTTKIGFRGGNSHTGDRENFVLAEGERPTFLPFPGEIICDGIISQGAAGRMGSGSQMVAVMPYNVVFRTSYSGSLYGAPGSHYYLNDKPEQSFLSVTWDERVASDIF